MLHYFGLSSDLSDPSSVLVHRLVCSWHMAAGQLAVFQGASEAPLSES
jgi:hypothetical protein